MATLTIATSLRCPERVGLHMGKNGTIWQFFVLSFLALGRCCLQMLCLPGFGTHANTQNLPHSRAFHASTQEHSPPKCLFFMANAKLPNRPGFALLQSRLSGSEKALREISDHCVFVGARAAGVGTVCDHRAQIQEPTSTHKAKTSHEPHQRIF